ncbi:MULTISPECIES: hypothetical protein [Streptomyces]|uniref:hypothetical protein n=1 Tax=Streptomyces TaxID=1883 RepID=UPI000F783E2B|nr:MULTISPECIES: hypothetical protein [Streptomyces]RST02269.1 hypothetical protein EF910_24195 [Streptomyces sp. WAC07149]GLX19954.1 hypothetical protein Slala01_35980 [Streptomyces lavendulae subsp. lavendulae]GLX27612.1 hypothetical protein Slala02_34320 [Streptomyces lavendulae subsp. lavendulae]
MAQHWTHAGGGWLPPRRPRPGVVPLRPLGPGEILGGAAATLRRYGGTLCGALLLGQLAGALLVAAAAGAATLASLSRSSGSRVFVWTLFPAAALFLLFTCALATALIAVLLRPAVLGRAVTVPGLLRAALTRTPAVLGAQLLALFAATAPVVAAGAAGLPALALLPLLPVALWLGVLFALAPTAAGYEGLRPVAALRRSARLVRGAWWRTLGVTAPAAAFTCAAGYALQAWFGPAGALSALVLLPAFPQLPAGLLYVDRLIRREHLAEALATDPGAGAVSSG